MTTQNSLYLLPLDGDPFPQRPPVHPVETLSPLLREALLHGLVEAEDLLLGLLLQLDELGVEPEVGAVNLTHDVVLVLVQAPLELGEGLVAAAVLVLAIVV